MYSGYLAFGGNEVVNNERVRGYSETSIESIFWLKGPRTPGLRPAVSPADTYTGAFIQQAPWFDSSAPDPATRFYGCFGIDISGSQDSTRTAPVSEGLDDGGVIGRSREGVKSVRVRAVLVGRGQDAMEHGMSWLKAVLSPGACGQHGDACGVTDAQYFTAPVPEQTGDLAQAAIWQAKVDGLSRFLHGVAVTSGPFIVEQMEARGFNGYLVEWTMTAGRPWVYGVTQDVQLPALASTVVADVPHNLVPYPSAEIAGASVELARNLATNPSVEVDTTGWTASFTPISGADPSSLLTSSRVTELSSSGGASFRTKLTGSGSGSTTGRCWVNAYQAISLSGVASGTRLSFNIWGALYVLGTGTTVNSFSARAEWYNGSTLLSTTSLGSGTSADWGGKAFSLALQTIPAGATDVRVILSVDVSWTSSGTASVNSDVRLYADALAVTTT